nr:hypothetical protein [Gammaproteobacteria bacterium]
MFLGIMSDGMTVQEQILVEPDAFRVARESVVLSAELCAALAVCVYDDTQGAGGLLNLRYAATDESDRPIDLTDNTLSSTLLLMDRFCKELRRLGARKQSWRVKIFAHTPELPDLREPATTLVDLLKAYFADSRHPPACEEFRRSSGIVVHLDPREGRHWVIATHERTGGAPRRLNGGRRHTVWQFDTSVPIIVTVQLRSRSVHAGPPCDAGRCKLL